MYEICSGGLGESTSDKFRMLSIHLVRMNSSRPT